MVTLSLLINKSVRCFSLNTLSLLVLLASSFVHAGGYEYKLDPNADMKLSLLYDPHRPAIVPYSHIIEKLFRATINSSETSASAVNETNFIDAVNTISMENERSVKVVSESEPASLSDGMIELPHAQWPNWGICQSMKASSLNFISAIAADSKISEKNYSRLLSKRLDLLHSCASVVEIDDLKRQKTPYDTYLIGIYHFYDTNFSEAIQYFKKVQKQRKRWFKNNDTWLLEAATYSIARAQSLQAQDDSPSDPLLLDQSIKSFDQYLERYPNGQYVHSAMGLKRRAHYLKGDMASYKREFHTALVHRLTALTNTPKINRDSVLAFKTELIEYTRFFDNDYGTLLNAWNEAVSTQSNNANPVAEKLSRELGLLVELIDEYKTGALAVRDLATLERYALFELYLSIYVRDWQRSSQHETLIQTVEKYSEHFHYNSDPDLLLANSIRALNGAKSAYDYSGYSNFFVKRELMKDICFASVGERILFEPKHRLNADKDQFYLARLFANYYLRTGDFAKLQNLYSLYNDTALYEYSSLRTAVNDIAKGKENVGKGYLNIGYFLSLRNAERSRPTLTEQCDQNNDKRIQPLVGYDYLEKAESILKEGEDHAKTMHFLVLCSSYQLSCDGRYNDGLAVSDRKPSKYWFIRLHKEYKNSEWAEKTPYYFDD